RPHTPAQPVDESRTHKRKRPKTGQCPYWPPLVNAERKGRCQSCQSEGQQQNANGIQRLPISSGEFAFCHPDLRCRECDHTNGNVDEKDRAPSKSENIRSDQKAAHDLCSRGSKTGNKRKCAEGSSALFLLEIGLNDRKDLRHHEPCCYPEQSAGEDEYHRIGRETGSQRRHCKKSEA